MADGHPSIAMGDDLFDVQLLEDDRGAVGGVPQNNPLLNFDIGQNRPTQHLPPLITRAGRNPNLQFPTGNNMSATAQPQDRNTFMSRAPFSPPTPKLRSPPLAPKVADSPSSLAEDIKVLAKAVGLLSKRLDMMGKEKKPNTPEFPQDMPYEDSPRDLDSELERPAAAALQQQMTVGGQNNTAGYLQPENQRGNDRSAQTVRSWGVVFDGKPDNSVEKFIFKVESNAEDYFGSYNVLDKYGHLLLTGAAEAFY